MQQIGTDLAAIMTSSVAMCSVDNEVGPDMVKMKATDLREG